MSTQWSDHLVNDGLETIRIFVEKIISSIGIQGSSVPILRHVLLALVAVLLAFAAERFCKLVIVPLIQRLVRRTEAKWDDVIFDHQVLRTACHIVPALIVWKLLPLVFYQFPLVQEVLSRLTAVYLTVAATRLIVGIIDRLRYLNTRPGSSVGQYVKSFCGVLKILILFIAAVVVISILISRSPLTLLAGLGATSAVLMLVFKDTIEGLVAGVRLTSNEMVHIGDWITIPGGVVNGIVTDITLTTVKVRQFDNTIMTVSPLTLVNGTFQNWKGMKEGDGRRVQKLIYFDVRSIRLADEGMKRHLLEKGFAKEEHLKGEVVNMGLFRHYLEHYLAGRDDVNEQMTLMVRQQEATQCGVPIELYFFLTKKDWVPYEHALADILEHVYAYACEFGLKVYEQYPEQ
ncbi:MAG: mechanosensitive ion channel family protein [Prevotella sp.]|nr:mechanosensitive ion channel family protein [Prevotella sp.]